MKPKQYLNLSAPEIHRGDQTQSNSIRRRWLAMSLGGLLLTSICALLPSPSQAQCQRWDVSGQWSIHQKDGQLQVNLQLGDWQGQSANITGTGRLATKNFPDFAADIDGNITGNALAMRVTVGKFIFRYVGTIGPYGKIGGSYHTQMEGKDVGTETPWNSYKKMKCADAAEKSSSNDTEDRWNKHKKRGGKHHHHDDDDQNRGND